MRTRTTQLLAISLLALACLTEPVAAQDERCFPETGHCISGRFRQFWEQNGGLSVFGYPLTPATEQVNPDDGQTYLTQVFERQRFELHPESAAPYDVQLGRLGNDVLVNQGYDWQQESRATPIAGCRYFEETGHNLCDELPDQQPRTGFRSYWETNGLADPALNRYGRSLVLFGLPLTEWRYEINSSGEQVITQYFERARLELPIAVGDGQITPRGGVLQGRLGAELRQNVFPPQAIAPDVILFLAADENSLAWIGPASNPAEGFTIYTADSNGSNVQAQLTGVSDTRNLRSVQIDETYAFSSRQDGVILRRPRAGGNAETLVQNTRGAATLALDGEFVYWTDVSGFISRVPKNGGTPTELVQTGGQVRDLAFDADYIYWYLYDGSVNRLPKAGGEIQRLAEGVGDGSGGQIVVDDTNVYVAYIPGNPIAHGGVIALPKGGGAATTLDSNVNPVALAVDGTNVFWTTVSGFVKAAPKAGGPATVLVAAQDTPTDLFVNNRGIYWHNQNGALMFAELGG